MATIVRIAALAIQHPSTTSSEVQAQKEDSDDEDDDEGGAVVRWAMRCVSTVLHRRTEAARQLVALLTSTLRTAFAAAPRSL